MKGSHGDMTRLYRGTASGLFIRWAHKGHAAFFP